MRYFVRSGSRNGFTGSAEVSQEQREKALAAFKLRPGEQGLSLFEIRSPKERLLVAAALVCRKRSIEPVDLISATDEDIERFGNEQALFRRRSEEHTSELHSHLNLVSRLLLE